MSDEKKLAVIFDGLTEAQALALQAMFKQWEQYSRIGASRPVGFFVDGDGSFHPRISMDTSGGVRDLTDDLERAAVMDDEYFHVFDHDGVAWVINHE